MVGLSFHICQFKFSTFHAVIIMKGNSDSVTSGGSLELYVGISLATLFLLIILISFIIIIVVVAVKKKHSKHT